MPAQFLVSILVARSIGPEQFGLAGVFISLQTLLMVCVTFGFDELLQREISKNQSSMPVAIERSLRARFLGASSLLVIVAIACLVLSIRGSGRDIGAMLILLGLAAAGNLISTVFVSVGLSTNRVTVPYVASLISWLVPLGCALSGIVTDAVGYAAILALGSVVRLALTGVWVTKMRWWAIVVRACNPFRRGYLLDGTHSHLALLAYGLNNQVLARHGDVIVAGIMGISLSLIGSYGLAFQITATANSFLMLGLGAIGLSRMSEEVNDPTALGYAWRRLSAIASMLAMGPLAILPLVAPEVVKIAVGDSYPELVPLLICLCAVQWLNRITGGGTNIGALIALGLTSTVARTSVVGAVVNVTLSFALIPFFGVYGLVLSTAVAVSAIGVLNTVTVWRHLRVRPPLGALAATTAVVALCVGVAAGGAPVVVRSSLVCLVAVIWLSSLIREVRR